MRSVRDHDHGVGRCRTLIQRTRGSVQRKTDFIVVPAVVRGKSKSERVRLWVCEVNNIIGWRGSAGQPIGLTIKSSQGTSEVESYQSALNNLGADLRRLVIAAPFRHGELPPLSRLNSAFKGQRLTGDLWLILARRPCQHSSIGGHGRETVDLR